MGAELLVKSADDVCVWVSTPTWANHFPLLESAGVKLQSYEYYDFETGRVNFAKMLDSIAQIPSGDAVLLHACCHNPSGADINHAQWDQIIEVLKARNILPFFDIAYQGFGDSLDDDAYCIRKACEELNEVMVASSCSKNFGLYRERTGAISIVSNESSQANAARSHVLSAARKSYSMSPYHGGGLVGLVLDDAALKQEWQQELEFVCARMNRLRKLLADRLNDAQSVKDFTFVGESKGMFCFLGITEEQVLQLRSEYGIYLLNSTRINIAGVSEANVDVIVDRVAKVIS
jgi:aspartate aminotransferase